MSELPLTALRAFAAVYEHGGIRPAARELGISHSALSRHVGELADWLGVALTDEPRGRAGIRFTPQGESLGKAAVAGLRELERAVAAIREARSPDAVVVSTTASVATRWLLPRLGDLAQRHPRLELSVHVDQRVVDPEREGVDLAIRMGRGGWPDVEAVPLMTDAVYPVANPRYWRTAGGSSRPAALRGMQLLHDRDPVAGWELWRREHGPANLDVRRGPRFTSSDLVLRAAAAGIGVALARDRLVGADLASGALVRPFGPLQVDLGVAYWLILPPHARARPATAAVIAWLTSAAQLPAAVPGG